VSGKLAAFGVLLIIVAIPFGLMLAPLAIGVIILVVALRRIDGALAIADPSAGA
jgi:hypothetical protein